MNNPPQLIIANGYKQARHLAKYHMRLKIEEWRYVHQFDEGWLSLNPDYILVYGTHYNRPDWAEIQAVCKARGIALLYVEECR